MNDFERGYREGRERAAEDIRALAADRGRIRPLRKDAETPTDFADELEWAAMIAEGSAQLRKVEDTLTAVMPRVNGVPFRCTCGANVFTHHSETDYFVCNGCGSVYEGMSKA